MKKALSTTILIALGLFIGFGAKYLQAQFSTAQSALINTGSNSQIKAGGLEVAKNTSQFVTFGQSYLFGGSTYVGSSVSGGPSAELRINGNMYVNNLSGAGERGVCADGNGKLFSC